MKILDRYLLRRFYSVFVVVLAGILLLYLVVHFFERIDTYIDKKAHPRDLLVYYATLVPYLLVLLLPMAELLGVFFSIGEMARRFEILAIRSAGVSTFRIFFPLFLASLFHTALAFAIGDQITPRATRFGEDFKNERILKRKTPRFTKQASEVSFFDRAGRIYYFTYLDATRNWGRGVMIYEVKEGRLRRVLVAREGRFQPDSAYWRLFSVTIQHYGDTSFVERYAVRGFPELTITPGELLKRPDELEELTLREILEVIRLKRAAGLERHAEWVALHMRIAFPFANVILMLFAFPLALESRGRGRSWGFGVSLMFAFVYWTLLQTSQIVGQTGRIPAFVSAWLPNTVFFLMGAVQFFRIHRRF